MRNWNIAIIILLLLISSGCGSKSTNESVQSPDTKNSKARQFISTIKGVLDDDMTDIFSQISINYSNSWRNGEKRYFEYDFEDGSSLILVAVPKESGGLKLYMIDIANTPGEKRWKSQ